jgi:hypothetical protein
MNLVLEEYAWDDYLYRQEVDTKRLSIKMLNVARLKV